MVVTGDRLIAAAKAITMPISLPFDSSPVLRERESEREEEHLYNANLLRERHNLILNNKISAFDERDNIRINNKSVI